MPADQAAKYSFPSSSSSSSRSTSYDYSGFDDLVKRQDALGATRDARFSALYNGDIAGSVSAGNKVRDLLSAIRAHAPGATEHSAIQAVTPLVRVSSQSSSSNSDYDAGGAEFAGNDNSAMSVPDTKSAAAAAPAASPKPQEKPVALPQAGGRMNRRSMTAPPATDVMGNPNPSSRYLA